MCISHARGGKPLPARIDCRTLLRQLGRRLLMRGSKAWRTFAVALALAALAATSAGASNHENSRDREEPYVVPGNTDGVNPVAHPDLFGKPPNYACYERFRSYEWTTGTYLGFDGRRHPCRAR
jgi:BA14K-like protein